MSRIADIDAACPKVWTTRIALVREVIAGLHIEGPFINERDGYVGAHPRDCVVPASLEGMKELLEAAGGLTKLVTLAPERDEENRVTRFLAEQGIVIGKSVTIVSSLPEPQIVQAHTLPLSATTTSPAMSAYTGIGWEVRG